MTTVFLSFAGAEPRELGRADEWAQRLRDAGFEVIDHVRYVGEPRIIADLARSDATVALVSQSGQTWAAMEQTASAYGTDTLDGTQPSWPAKPTLLWFRDPVWDDSPNPRPVYPYLVELLESGRATRLPADFEAAVARAIEIIRGQRSAGGMNDSPVRQILRAAWFDLSSLPEATIDDADRMAQRLEQAGRQREMAELQELTHFPPPVAWHEQWLRRPWHSDDVRVFVEACRRMLSDELG
jgi:hypothetical protein